MIYSCWTTNFYWWELVNWQNIFQQILSLCDSISLESDSLKVFLCFSYQLISCIRVFILPFLVFFISRIERTVIMTLKESVLKSSLLILSEREMRNTHILFWWEQRPSALVLIVYEDTPHGTLKPFFCPVESFNEPDKAHSELCLHSGLHLLTFVLTLQQSPTLWKC